MVTFHGIVNGVEYGTVEAYNEAVKAAQASGQPWAASSRTTSTPDDAAGTPVPPTASPNEPQAVNVVPAMPNFDLSALGSDASKNEELVAESEKLFSLHNANALLEKINTIQDPEKHAVAVEFATRILKEAASNKADNNVAQESLEKKYEVLSKREEQLENELDRVRAEMDDISTRQNVVDCAEDILEDQIRFYEYVVNHPSIVGEATNADSQSGDGQCLSGPDVLGRQALPESVYDLIVNLTPEQIQSAGKLFSELFGDLFGGCKCCWDDQD